VLVYSFGATFDATVVAVAASAAVSDPQIVGAPQDLERLGGGDFDQVVFNHVVGALGGALQQLDRNDPAVHQAVATLRAACITAKERLSTESDATVVVSMPGLATEVRITRDEFEAALRPHIAETLNAVDRALASADIKPTELRGIVLVGGSSRIPLVAEMLAGHLGRPVLSTGDQRVCVALGAACGPSRHTTQTADAPPPISTPTLSPILTKETPMSDQSSSTPAASPDVPAPAAAPPASSGTGGRATPPPPPPPSRGAPSKAAKVAGGVAAAAAVVAGVVAFGDDAVDAVFGDDGDDVAQAAGAETNQPQRNEREGDGGNQSMDAFEHSASAASAASAAAHGDAVTGAPVQGPLGTPLASQVGSVQEAALHQQAATFAPAAHTQPIQQEPVHHQAQAQQAPVHQDAPMTAASEGPPQNADFEAARATLLDRLDNFQAPPGTSPEDAAALKQELVNAIERFEPAAGQTTEQALAALRDDYDQRVQDFTQDQKIDALVREAQRDNAADAAGTAATPAAAATTATATPPPDGAADPNAATADATAATGDANAATPIAGDTNATTGDAATGDADPTGTAGTAGAAGTSGTAGETVTTGDAVATGEMASARFAEAATNLTEVTELTDVSVLTATIDTAGGAGAAGGGESERADGSASGGADARASAVDDQSGASVGESERSDLSDSAGGAAERGALVDDQSGAAIGESERADVSGSAGGAAAARGDTADDQSAVDMGRASEVERADAGSDAAGGAHPGDDADPGPSNEAGIEVPTMTIDLSSQGLVDDFDSLTAEPVGASAVIDAGPALATEPVTVIDVRASLPETDGPRPIMVVDDVVGDSTYTDVVQAATVDVAAAPLVLTDVDVSVSAAVVVDPAPVLGATDGTDGNDGGDGADGGPTDGIDGPAPLDMSVTIDTVDATAVALTPLDDDSGGDDSVDFATDIASDITPNTPTDLNFGP
jgi:hypothetical protein